MTAATRASRSAHTPDREDGQAIPSRSSMTACGALRDLCAHTKKTTLSCDRHFVGHRRRECGSTRAQEQGLLPRPMPLTGARATTPRLSVYAKGAATFFNAQGPC